MLSSSFPHITVWLSDVTEYQSKRQKVILLTEKHIHLDAKGSFFEKINIQCYIRVSWCGVSNLCISFNSGRYPTYTISDFQTHLQGAGFPSAYKRFHTPCFLFTTNILIVILASKINQSINERKMVSLVRYM